MKEHSKVDSKSQLLEPYIFPPTTKLIPDEEYVDLEVIDLSDFHALESGPLSLQDPSRIDVHTDIIARTMKAFRTLGFIAVKGLGLGDEQIHRQFSLGKLLAEVPESEKIALHASIKEGSWAGYKPQGYYYRPDGAFDTLEHYGLYPSTTVESRLPGAAKPFFGEIKQFMEYNHYVILRKILEIISRGLGLEPDSLWKLHHRGRRDNGSAVGGGPDEKLEWLHTKDHLRYAMYHPPTERDRVRKRHLWLGEHTDLGSVNLLYSQPVAGLQVLTPGGEWRYIRHYPNHVIVDLGDSMEFVTGGVLKAAPHRVKEPPEDQRHLDRLGLFYFFRFLPDVVLSPLNHPSLRALGAKDMFPKYLALGGKPMTSDEWVVARSKMVGTTNRVTRQA